MLNVTQALLLIARTEFVPFTQSDWDAFCGCESENPLIGYNGDYCLVLDGDTVNIIGSDDEYGGQLFNLNEI
jgi:hypothetical protein